MNKYEQLIEHIINNDEGKARALFHDIVVEKSRDIYESLMDEESMEEDIHGDGNAVDRLVDEITVDETHIGEGDDDTEMEFDLDHEEEDGEVGGEFDMGDEGEGEDLETKVMDLETELDALRAEFEKLVGDEEGMDDMGDEEGDMDDMGDMGDMDDMDDEEGDMGDMDDEEGDMGDMDDEEKGMMESSNKRSSYQKSAVDIMREYVEKVSAPSNTEFTPVGTSTGGDKASGNTKHIVAGKNDMGGSSANIAKGGSESAPDGQRPTGKAGGFMKNPQEVEVAKRNVNKPGGNKGAQDFYGTKASAKKGEGQTTDGSVPVNKTSIEKGGN
jgi:hypothetical protein